jgi:tetratricopeptide (TPR) repeat protein
MGGIALVHQDSLERSIPWLEGALEVNPKDPLGNYYLGNALNQLNRAEQAVPHLVAAIQGRPQWVSALSALAGSYESLKQYTLADSFYTAALALDPENALVLNNYGYSLSERGIRLEEAASMARKAIDKDPGNGAYLDTMGWIYYKMGDFGQALSFIEKAYGLRPKSADVVEHLGDVYNKLERRDEAVKYWERALELNPGNAGLLHKLGRPVPEVP